MKSSEFKIIKEYLPSDWAKTIAKEIDCTPEYVRLVARDKRQSEEIDDAIFRLAKSEKAKSKRKEKRRKRDLNSFK